MKTRRNFLSNLAKAVAAFGILPAATTYVRQWKQTNNLWIPNPEWNNAQFEVVYCIKGNEIIPALFDANSMTVVRYNKNGTNTFSRIESHIKTG